MKIIYNIGVNILGQSATATHYVPEGQASRPEQKASALSNPVAKSTPDYTLNRIAREDRMVFFDGVTK